MGSSNLKIEVYNCRTVTCDNYAIIWDGKLHISYPNALYHDITCRGNKREDGRENIFFSDKDREKFLKIVESTQERYNYILHAYVLMDNHFHLLIETPLANIQAVMHNINTTYTVYINRKCDRWGHLFQGRYKTIIVDKDNYLLVLSRYIHLNPVRASIVSRPEDYPWSSYCYYIGRAAPPPYLHTVTTLAYFSTKSGEAQRGYRRFVEEAIHDEGYNPLVGVKGALVLGCEEFVRRIRNMIDKCSCDSELPSARRILPQLEIRNALEVVSRHLDMPLEELQRRSRGKTERSQAIYLVKRVSQVNNTVLGRYFGISGAAIGAQIRQVELEMRRN